MSETEAGLSVVREAIAHLEEALRACEALAGRPGFVGEEGRERFRYMSPTGRIFQMLKAVRVVSAYNASVCLLEKGYGQETCALLRIIFEALHDMDFIAEAYFKEAISEKQQMMLDLYFEEDIPVPEEMLSRHNKKPTVPRKNVYAELSKVLSPQNPDRTQKLIRMLEEAYSGYVHCAYPHTMELYVGGAWRFETGGMPKTPRQAEALRAVVRSLSQALNQFAKLSALFGRIDLFTRLVEQRKELEKTPFYGKKAG